MSTPSLQQALSDSLLQHFPSAEVKKIDKDNYVDIHLPWVHPKRGTHLGFNTAGNAIKIVFYCREEEWVEQALSNSGGLLEKYSQGVRLKGHPEFLDVETAIAAALKFIDVLGQKSVPSEGVQKSKSETYTFDQAVKAYLQGNIDYVAAYVQEGNPVLQFNGDILITNELISYVCTFTEVDQRIVDLVDAGMDLDASFDDGEGYTAAHFAAWDGKHEILTYLLEAGANSDVVGEDGYTPLFLAASGGHLACIEILVEKGANVNRRLTDDNIYSSKQGGTPLTMAFINGFLELCLFLIDNGADPFVLKEPCKNAPSPDLFVNFLSLVKQGTISSPQEGQLSKILSLLGLDEKEISTGKNSGDPENSGQLGLNDFLAELEAATNEEESNEEEETEAADSGAPLDLASFLASMETEDDADQSEVEEDEEEDESENEEELGYPMISWWGKDIDTEKLGKYANKWQTKSEVYGWVGGISGFIPDWYEDLSTEEICPAFSQEELLEIATRVANEKIIPILNYAPEDLFNHVKRVWWIVPFCIWKEDVASFVFVDKNGFYAMFKNKEGEVVINDIFPWDRVSELEFETEYAGDSNVNRLTLHQGNGGFLTFDEFVGVGDDGKLKGSYLAVIESIWLARKVTIEASKGVPMWYEGKGGEGFADFDTPQDLLNPTNWDNPHRPNPGMFGG
uniref:ankyrin repeat domain-containing protein n=1 Tax=Algoriphagus sp. TaxID=1872435 RepID=UPI0040484264